MGWKLTARRQDWDTLGEWGDSALGMTYLRARWYDGYLNQFVGPDPIAPDYRNPQSTNRYVYAFGDPLNMLDPAGRFPSREEVAAGSATYSCHCGWIDWDHASPMGPRRTYLDIKAAIQNDQPYGETFQGKGCFLPGGGCVAGGVAKFTTNLTEEEIMRITLGIQMTYHEQWESITSLLPKISGRSGYTEEDLASDLIGFYRAVNDEYYPDVWDKGTLPPEAQDTLIGDTSWADKAKLANQCGFPADEREAISKSLDIWDEYPEYETREEWNDPRLYSCSTIDDYCGELGITERRWPTNWGESEFGVALPVEPMRRCTRCAELWTSKWWYKNSWCDYCYEHPWLWPPMTC